MNYGTLHIISHLNAHVFLQVSQMLAKEDALLLIQDAVIAGTQKSPHAFLTLPNEIYLLHADLEARGLISHILPTCQIVNDQQFVNLVITYPRNIHWT